MGEFSEVGLEVLTEVDKELLDPHPDIHALFVHYNTLYFDDQLGACSVEWSSARMTLCGGVCEWRPGGGCRIKLSEPLLKLRPARELKEVLLHEMIHAYMMLGGIKDDEPSGHGTIFKSTMKRINTSTVPDSQRPVGGYNITTHHTMFAEVDHYRQHHWQCERCGHLVKRAMNRPPQEADCRGRNGKGADCRDPYCHWHMHLRHCGGTFQKIKEPEGYGQKKRGKKTAGSAAGQSQVLPAKRPKKEGSGNEDIAKYFRRPGPSDGATAAAAGEGGSGEGTALEGTQAAQKQPLPSAVHPALEAVTGAGGAAAQQGPSRHSAEPQQAQQPSAEERRRQLAEAALRRLGGYAAGQAQPSSSALQPQEEQAGQRAFDGAGHTPARPTRDPSPVPSSAPSVGQEQGQGQAGSLLLLAQSGAQQAVAGKRSSLQPQLLLPGPGTQQVEQVQQLDQAQQQQQAQQAQPSEHAQQGKEQAQQQVQVEAEDVIDLTCSPPELQQAQGHSTHSTEREGGRGGALQCPICGRRWEGGALSNDALNAHIDECLSGEVW